MRSKGIYKILIIGNLQFRLFNRTLRPRHRIQYVGRRLLVSELRLMTTTIDRWSNCILFLEELDKVRCVGEGALVANLRDRLGCRDKQQTRVGQSLANIPLVGRQLEMTLKLLLERSERTVANLG